MPCKGDHNVLTNTYNTIFTMYEQENKAYDFSHALINLKVQV